MNDLFNTIEKIVDDRNLNKFQKSLALDDKPTQWDTSAEAKMSIAPHMSKMKARVLLPLQADGDATDDELEQRLGMSHQSLSACRRGCVKDDLVHPTGKTRPTRSGRSANVWTITEAGICKLHCGGEK